VKDSTQPRVAVLIPCFDDGATILEAIESVESQGESCEVVVIDDGSRDEPTLALLEELAGRGVRVLRQENAGPGAARNRGLEATSAPYVLALDADDRLPAGAVMALADTLDADPSLALAWGDVEVFGDWAGPMRKADTLDPWLITYINEIPIAALVRRQELVPVGGWRARRCEDWSLWMSLAERGTRGVRIPKATLEYRVHGERNGSRDFADLLRVNDELRRLHQGLYRRRRATWRTSDAPLLLRLTLPVLERLPLVSPQRKKALSWLAADVAYRRLGTTAPVRLARLGRQVALLRDRFVETRLRAERPGG